MNPHRAEEPVARYLAALEPPLLRSFDLLAGAPKGLARLRELILSLAVRGKLVPQDPSDEPASVLLERIRVEKALLVAEGKIRRDKPLAEISEEEKPFGLPEGWEWARLSAVTHDWGQQTPITDFTYIDVASIDNERGCVASDVQVIAAADAPSRARKVVTKGTVIYSTVRPYLKNIALVEADYSPPPIASTAFAVMHPHSGLDASFLFFSLRSQYFTDFVASKMLGVAYPAINDSNFFQGVLPLPPLAEQSRIVARIEALMRLCDQLEAKGRLETEQHAQLVGTLFETLAASESAHALAENWQRIAEHFDLLLDRPEAVDALEQTLLQLAVRGLLVPQDPADEPASALLEKIRAEKHRLIAAGKLKRDKPLPSIAEDEKPFELPERWEWVRFGEVTNISSGVTLGRKTPIKEPVSLPYLRVANVQRGHLVLSVTKEVTIDRSELERFQLQENDLLITEGGDWDKVGRTCIWRGEVAVCLHQNHVFKARAVSTKWNPLWAELYLNSTDARTYFAASAKQTTNLASINMGELKVCLFPLPPLAEQSRIVIRVEQLRHLCADLRARLGEARATQSRLAKTLVDTSTV